MKNKMIGKILHKVKNKQGISLAELLVTLIFCLLTFALVVTAMQAATRQLKKSTMQSESKMLCSSLTMSIEDVLRYAGVGTGNGGESAISGEAAGRDSEHDTGKPVSDIKFYSRSRGRGKNCYLDVTSDGHIVFMYPNPAAGSGSDEKLSADMAPGSTYTQGMKAYLLLQWHNDDTDMKTYQSFTGTVTVTDKDNKVLNTQSFAVTPVNINR